MADCGFGASGLKIKSSDLVCLRPSLRTLRPLHGVRAPKIVRFRFLKMFATNANVESNSKESESDDAVSTLTPNAFEVESLLNSLCDTTTVVEFELKKDIVKEGKVLCYIEQLGGEVPIESDISGEVVKILRKDGDPVGYGDALIAVLPSFPGIKKLQ